MGDSSLPRRLRLARVLLLYAAILSGYLLWGLPAFSVATSAERVSTATLLVVMGAALFSVVALTRRRRAGWAVAVGVGLLCAQIAAVRAPQLAAQFATPYPSPAVVLAWLLGGSALVAPVLAMLCCLSLRRWRDVLM